VRFVVAEVFWAWLGNLPDAGWHAGFPAAPPLGNRLDNPGIEYEAPASN
jgi:hypothetical protein